MNKNLVVFYLLLSFFFPNVSGNESDLHCVGTESTYQEVLGGQLSSINRELRSYPLKNSMERNFFDIIGSLLGNRESLFRLERYLSKNNISLVELYERELEFYSALETNGKKLPSCRFLMFKKLQAQGIIAHDLKHFLLQSGVSSVLLENQLFIASSGSLAVESENEKTHIYLEKEFQDEYNLKKITRLQREAFCANSAAAYELSWYYSSWEGGKKRHVAVVWDYVHFLSLSHYYWICHDKSIYEKLKKLEIDWERTCKYFIRQVAEGKERNTLTILTIYQYCIQRKQFLIPMVLKPFLQLKNVSPYLLNYYIDFSSTPVPSIASLPCPFIHMGFPRGDKANNRKTRERKALQGESYSAYLLYQEDDQNEVTRNQALRWLIVSALTAKESTWPYLEEILLQKTRDARLVMVLNDWEKENYTRLAPSNDPAALYFLSKHEEELGNERAAVNYATKLGKETMHVDSRLYGIRLKIMNNQVHLEQTATKYPSSEEFIQSL